MKHVCHALFCKNACPPKHLMCAPCWSLVSKSTQAEVYRTVKLRDMSGCDHTWAPWWRASHLAMYEVAIANNTVASKEEADRWLARQMKIADSMERTDG